MFGLVNKILPHTIEEYKHFYFIKNMIFGFEVLKIISVPRKTVKIPFYFTKLLIGIIYSTELVSL